MQSLGGSAPAKGPASPGPERQLNNIKPRRKRIGRLQFTQTKVFGGSLEEYLELTGEEIPLIMRSCIKIINLYGKLGQSIFFFFIFPTILLCLAMFVVEKKNISKQTVYTVR